MIILNAHSWQVRYFVDGVFEDHAVLFTDMCQELDGIRFLKGMIDDLWWYGDTMWYVYIIDIYRYPSVCVNAVPICSNLLDDWVWMWWDSWSARLSFFCSFCAGLPTSDRFLNSGPVFAVRYHPILVPQDTLADGEPFEVSDLPFPEVNSPGNYSSWNDSSRVTPGDVKRLWFLRKLHQAAIGRTQWWKMRDPYNIVSPYNSFCNYSHRFGGTEISEMPGSDFLWVILVWYHFYTSISMILDSTIMIWAAQAKLFSMASESV